MARKTKGMKKSKRSKKQPGNHVAINHFPQFSGAALGLPARKTVTMRYCETINLAMTTGAMAVYDWSSDDLFDPNITGAGHQPYGFDQWCLFYTKFTVLKSSCKIHVASSGVPISAGVFFSRGAAGSTISSAMGLIEATRGTACLVTGSSAPPQSASSNFDLRITDPDFDPGSFFCTSAASPTFRYHYTLYAQPTDLGSSVTLQGYICIDYEVLLEDPVTVASS